MNDREPAPELAGAVPEAELRSWFSGEFPAEEAPGQQAAVDSPPRPPRQRQLRATPAASSGSSFDPYAVTWDCSQCGHRNRGRRICANCNTLHSIVGGQSVPRRMDADVVADQLDPDESIVVTVFVETRAGSARSSAFPSAPTMFMVVTTGRILAWRTTSLRGGLGQYLGAFSLADLGGVRVKRTLVGPCIVVMTTGSGLRVSLFVPRKEVGSFAAAVRARRQ